MSFSAIDHGFPSPNFFADLGQRQAISPGVYHGERGAAHSTATASVGNLTLAAAGHTIVTGASSATIDDLTLSASGQVIVSGALGATIDDLTLSASGQVVVSGALGATIDDLTLSASGQVVVSGALGATIDDLTLSASGQVIVSGALGATIDDLTLVATEAEIVTGTLDATFGNLSLAAAGDVIVSGACSASLDALGEIAPTIGTAGEPAILAGGLVRRRKTVWRWPVAGRFAAKVPPLVAAASAVVQQSQAARRKVRRGEAIAAIPGFSCRALAASQAQASLEVAIPAIAGRGSGELVPLSVARAAITVAPVIGAAQARQCSAEDEVLVLLLAA
jgi:hypothetical protein